MHSHPRRDQPELHPRGCGRRPAAARHRDGDRLRRGDGLGDGAKRLHADAGVRIAQWARLLERRRPRERARLGPGAGVPDRRQLLPCHHHRRGGPLPLRRPAGGPVQSDRAADRVVERPAGHSGAPLDRRRRKRDHRPGRRPPQPQPSAASDQVHRQRRSVPRGSRGRGSAGGVPVVHWQQPAAINYDVCDIGDWIVEATITLSDGTVRNLPPLDPVPSPAPGCPGGGFFPITLPPLYPDHGPGEITVKRKPKPPVTNPGGEFAFPSTSIRAASFAVPAETRSWTPR